MERPGTPGVRSLFSPKSPAPSSRSTSATAASSSSFSKSGPSFAQRKAQQPRPSTRSNLVEGNSMMRNIDRPPPGDVVRRKSQVSPELAKKKSAYWENEFLAAQPDVGSNQVRNEAIVMAELRTNIMIQDELTTLTDLSYLLSNRYQRSTSAIVVNLQHSNCLMFGGSFDPAYILTIYALPELVQPTTNKRNAALMQTHIQETLGVPPSRGYIRFEATPEENIAHGGTTVAGHIDEFNKVQTDEQVVKRQPSKPMRSRRMLSIRSIGSIGNMRLSPLSPLEDKALPTPPTSTSTTGTGTDDGPMITTSIPEHPPPPPEKDHLDAVKKAVPPRRKSLVSLLFTGKGSANEKRPKTAVTLA